MTIRFLCGLNPAILFLLSVGSAQAEPDLQDKLCVFNAAPQLPVIAGLKILASRVTPLSRPKARRVELDISAAGIETTAIFDCEFDLGPTKVFPRGLTK